MAELELRLGCTSQTIYEKANAAAPGTFIPLVKEGRRTGALNSEVEAYLAATPSGMEIWLPRSRITAIASTPDHRSIDMPCAGETADFLIPDWLWLRHRPLCGDEAYEREKARRRSV